MPRTKVKRDSQSQLKDKQSKFLADFKRKAAAELKKLKKDLEMATQKVLNEIDIQFSQFPPEIQNMTLGEIFEILEQPDVKEGRDSASFKYSMKAKESRTTASDDGYVTDKTRSYKSKASRSRMEDTRSKQTMTLKKNTGNNFYVHTPANETPSTITTVTPKINPNLPINVLRRPRRGETVISITGSPLMVTSMVQEDQMANLSVPLKNGEVLSLLPTGNLRPSMLPTLSPRTKEQLRTLKNHIEKFIS